MTVPNDAEGRYHHHDGDNDDDDDDDESDDEGEQRGIFDRALIDDMYVLRPARAAAM